VTAELARLGGPLGAVGLAALLVLPGRLLRLAALALVALGGLLLVLYLAPGGHAELLAAGGVVALLAAGGLAALFLRRPWLAVLAALACVPARIPVEVGGEEANLLLPLYVVVLGAGLALAYELVRGDPRRRELGPLAWPLAGLVAWSGLSLAWSDDLREGAITLLAFVLPFGVLAVVVSRLRWDRRWVTATLGLLAAMALVFAAVGVYQWLARDVFWNPKVIVGNAYAPFYRVNSVFWDPSIYGRFLVVAILAGLVLVLFSPRRNLALAAGALIVAVWVGLLFSFSQSSFAALIAGVLVAAAFAWRRRAALALGLAAVVVVSVGVSAPRVRHALLRDSSVGLDRATSGRFELVTEGGRIALAHPVIGVGIGGFKRAFADRTGLRGREPKRAASHNTPVTVAAETGFPGLALFGWLLGAAFLAAWRHPPRSFEGRAKLTFGLALAAIAVHSLFYDAFFEDPMTWGLLALIALGMRALPAEADGRAESRVLLARARGRGQSRVEPEPAKPLPPSTV
jgi:O-antigen ligase